MAINTSYITRTTIHATGAFSYGLLRHGLEYLCSILLFMFMHTCAR